MRALLRREDRADNSAVPIAIGELVIDSQRREVEFRGNAHSLSTAEFDVLHMLAQQAGSVVSRDAIYEKLRRMEYDGVERSIDLYVSRIRKKLDEDAKHPKIIKTVRNAGYLLVSA